MTNSTQVERARFGARRTLLAISTILCSGVAAPALAQQSVDVPLHDNVDMNGVDLATGQIEQWTRAVSIGDMEYKVLTTKAAVTSSNWNWYISTSISGGVTYLQVASPTIAYKFAPNSSGGYSSTKGDGATLTISGGNYIFTDRSGQRVYFTGLQKGPNQIALPNGKIYTYNYHIRLYCVQYNDDICLQTQQMTRLSSITSNTGYMIKLQYVANGPNDFPGDIFHVKMLSEVIGLNTSVESCGATADFCSLSRAWPRASLEETDPGEPRQLWVTDAIGRETAYRWSSSGFLAGVKTPNNTTENITISTPTAAGFSITKPQGTWNYSFSASGNIRTAIVTDPMGHDNTYEFDITLQRMTKATDAAGHITTWQYDTNGRPTRITAPEGNYTQLTYDTRGNVTETRLVSKTPGTPPDIVTTANFPASCGDASCNRPVWTKDAKGNQTDYGYDTTTGNVTTVTAPAPNPAAPMVRPTTTYSYTTINGVQLLGGVSTCKSAASCPGTADEVKTTIGYNSNMLPTTVTKAAGDGSLSATTTIGYDDIGNVTSIDGPLPGTGDTTLLKYYADRTLAADMAPDPDGSGPRARQAHLYGYNGNGQRVSVERGTVPSQATDWTSLVVTEVMLTAYDADGRKTSDTLIAGGAAQSVVQYSYDAAGRLDCSAMRMNVTLFGSLPASACTLQAAGSAGSDRIAKYTYDNADRLTKVTSGYGTADASDDVTTTYTDNGQVATVADGKGNLTTYEYDGFDRPRKTRYPSPTVIGASSATDYEELTLDPNGNATNRRLRDGRTIGYSYDALNRVTAKTVPSGVFGDLDVSYEYDLLGHLTRATDAVLRVNVFGYDALGRLVSDGKLGGTTSYAYDAAGRRTRITWSDGFHVDYDYDVTGNMTAIRENGATSGAGVLASYGYDDFGRRTSLTRGNGVVTSYGYDPLSRLASLTNDLAGTAQDLTVTFGYNPANQITGRTASNDAYAWGGAINVDRPYTANGLNQYSAAGGVTFGYDTRGNLTSSGSTSYAYTAENRLATASTNGAIMAYEPAGGELLQLYTADGTDRRFVTSGGQIISETRIGAGLVGRYVFGPGADEPLVSYDASGNRSWLVADERGSIIAKTDASGVATAMTSYDEYGIPAGGDVGRFGYTGQAWLGEIGMSYYKARMYSPTLGRFMQIDPIGYDDGMNLYAYAHSDPINGVDPSGLDVWCGSSGYAVWGGGGVSGDTVTADYRCAWDWWNMGWGDGDGSVAIPGGAGGGGGGAPAVLPPPLAQPQNAQAKSTWDKLKACTAAQYGFGDGETPTGLDLGKAVSELGSLPVFKPLVGIPVIGESSSFTNVLNYTSLKLGLNTRFSGAALRGFTKAAFGSVRVATVLGRANVVIGGALLAYDAASIAICTNRE